MKITGFVTMFYFLGDIKPYAHIGQFVWCKEVSTFRDFFIVISYVTFSLVFQARYAHSSDTVFIWLTVSCICHERDFCLFICLSVMLLNCDIIVQQKVDMGT